MTTQETQIVFRYLPRTLVNNWNQNPDQHPVWGEWLEGSLIHCDVTGFTAMSEALASTGNEGAEIMANILNRFFDRMLGIAREWGAIQMKFGGDAMLLYFPDQQHAARAVACGLAMQTAMKEFRAVKALEVSYQLRMRIGVHSGRFYSASVGQEHGLLHYMLSGFDVNKTADVEPKAEPGQVVVSEETYKLLSKEFIGKATIHPGIFQIVRTTFSSDNIEHLTNIYQERKFQDVLHRYLMQPIINNQVANLAGEHRRTTILFIYVKGLSELLISKGEENTLKQLNTYINYVFEGLKKYEGYLIGSDASEHGDKLIIAFGVPVIPDQQESRAMRFACELSETLQKSTLDLTHQIGINSGFVFAGEIGSKRRREYTTIGDVTNLAARLMVAANQGQIIASASTAEKYTHEFELTKLNPIRVKGKSQPISIYSIDGLKLTEKAATASPKEHPPFTGRDAELQQLLDIAEQSQQRYCSLSYIHGESGIGKSRLCVELNSRLKERGWNCATGICQTYNQNNAFSAWYYPLRKITGIKQKDSQEISWQKLTDFIEKHIPNFSIFTPLLADILLITNKGNPIVNSLDAKTRHEKRVQTITELFATLSRQQPIALTFDNCQWLDSSSAELIKEILLLNASVMIVLSSRDNTLPAVLQDHVMDLNVHLSDLEPEAAKLLVKHFGVTDQDVDIVVERAKGNPLFLIELSHSISTGQAGGMPESVYDVVVSRLDHLDSQKKKLLGNASVIGQVFDSNILGDLVTHSYAAK